MKGKKSRTMKIGIFIDGQNLYHVQKELGVYINYEKLIRQVKKWFAEKNQKNVWVEFVRYYNLDISSEHATKHYKSFINKIKEFNIKIVGKDFKNIKNGNHSHRKLDFDLMIAVDAINLINLYDVFVLVSGDSDFNYLVEKLKGQQKNICIISTRDAISKELASSSHVIIWLEKIADEIKLKH